MKKGYVEIISILDRSGSMSSIKDDAIGGFNNFLNEQKKLPGKASFSIILFDNEYEVLKDNIDIQDIDLLTDKTFVPRGCTALLDAVGKTINSVGDRLSKTKEEDRPEKVMVCIVTDGQENASHNFTKTKIKDMIEHQRSKYGWEFLYLGANQDSFSEASSYGISSAYTSNFKADSFGMLSGCMYLSSTVASFRSN